MTPDRRVGQAVAACAYGAVAVGWLGAGAGYRNGDAAVYAAQAWSGDLGDRPVHAAYLLVAWLLAQIVGEDLPYVLDVLTALSAGAIVVAAAALVEGRGRALTALLVAIAVAPEASYGEVDLPWIALIAVAAAVPGPMTASVWAALAVAVSPTALAALPWVVVERARREPFAQAALPAIGGVLAVSALLGATQTEWWSGDRGVGRYAPDPWVTASAWGRRWDLLLASGVLAAAALRSPSGRARWTPVLATAPLLLAPADVPVWIVPAIALAAAAGEAVEEGMARARAGLVGLVLFGAGASALAWSATQARVVAENEVAGHVAASLGPEDGLVAPWSWGVRVSVLATGDPYGARWRATEPVRDQVERWCDAPFARIAALPPGATLPDAGEATIDAAGVAWYEAPPGWGCSDQTR